VSGTPAPSETASGEAAPGEPRPGTYTLYQNRPLPEAWKALLAPLLPAEALPPDAGLFLDTAGAAIDVCLHAPPGRHGVRDMETLWQLTACERSGADFARAHGFSRQRISQVLHQTLTTARAQGQELLDDLRSQFRQRVVLLRVGGPSVLHPGATGEQVWRLLIALLEDGSFHHRTLPGGRAVCGPPGSLDMTTAERLLETDARFWPLEELVRASGCSALVLRAAEQFGSPVRVTQGARVRHTGWTQPELFRAVATELLVHGVSDWHFSEMAHAANLLRPECPRALNQQHAASVLSRAPDGMFAPTGVQGTWRLAAPTDAAQRGELPELLQIVTNILHAADLPLTAQAVYEQLPVSRAYSFGTVRGLLRKHPGFASYGGGVYSLAGRALPELPEEAWAVARLAEVPGETLSVEAMQALAVRDAVDLARLEVMGRVSRRVQVRGGTGSVYCSLQAALVHDFHAWAHNQKQRAALLQPDVLDAALRLPRTRKTLSALRAAARAYRERGWEIPEALATAVASLNLSERSDRRRSP